MEESSTPISTPLLRRLTREEKVPSESDLPLERFTSKSDLRAALLPKKKKRRPTGKKSIESAIPILEEQIPINVQCNGYSNLKALLNLLENLNPDAANLSQKDHTLLCSALRNYTAAQEQIMDAQGQARNAKRIVKLLIKHGYIIAEANDPKSIFETLDQSKCANQPPVKKFYDWLLERSVRQLVKKKKTKKKKSKNVQKSQD